jgi:hypothetical protein
MAAQESPNDANPETAAQRAADRLAVALEDVGFDVGRMFPMLRSGLDSNGVPFVELGRVTSAVASHLSAVLSRAAGQGITL